MIDLVIYTHSSYFDVLDICINRIKKYLSYPFNNEYIITDKDYSNPNYKYLNYNDDDKYTNRLYNTISNTESDYLFFLHDDMILYDDANIKDIIDVSIQDEIDFIKVLKCDDNYSDRQYWHHPYLKYIPPTANMLFSIQPSVWKKSTLLNLLDKNLDLSIWDFERYGQNTMRSLDVACLYAYDKVLDKKRGLYHYDSHIFPYIATAVVKGKWNASEYPNEIKNLQLEYGLDLSFRGTI